MVCTTVCTIVADGVVLVDQDYMKDRKVFATILAAFRYGREDLDVLGLTFRKDLFLASAQVRAPYFRFPCLASYKMYALTYALRN